MVGFPTAKTWARMIGTQPRATTSRLPKGKHPEKYEKDLIVVQPQVIGTTIRTKLDPGLSDRTTTISRKRQLP
jgi:hypothetical protein